MTHPMLVHLRTDMLNHPEVVIYHGDGCRDGFCAAWVSRMFSEDTKLHSSSYAKQDQQELVDLVAGKRALVVDFCPDEDILADMQKSAAALVVLDHHADKAVLGEDNDNVLVDINRAGARLTWDYYTGVVLDDPFNPLPDVMKETRCDTCGTCFAGLDLQVGAPCPFSEDLNLMCEGVVVEWYDGSIQVQSYSEPPWVVSYVDDRDRWKFNLPRSQTINAALQCTPLSFAVWDNLLDLGPNEMHARGRTLLQHEKDLVLSTVKGVQYRDLLKYPNVAFCACTPGLHSAVGSYLVQDPLVPFAVMYWTHETGELKLSIRSMAGGTAGAGALRCPVCLDPPRKDQYFLGDKPISAAEPVPLEDYKCRVDDCHGRLLAWPPPADQIAANWGGGGHPGAAGVFIEQIDLASMLASALNFRTPPDQVDSNLELPASVAQALTAAAAAGEQE